MFDRCLAQAAKAAFVATAAARSFGFAAEAGKRRGFDEAAWGIARARATAATANETLTTTAHRKLQRQLLLQRLLRRDP